MKTKLILASSSPRRKELLESLGYNFEVVPANIDEGLSKNVNPVLYCSSVAERKARYVCDKINETNAIIVGADTIVVIDSEVLSKPDNELMAKEMLLTLSGRTHEVITGFTVCSLDHVYTKHVKTHVSFSKIPLSAIEYYVSEYKPFDKAGAYGIQEWIGMKYVESIVGDYFNVVGLPVSKVSAQIEELQLLLDE